jgi:two-component system chemotaxis response regulator CheB
MRNLIGKMIENAPGLTLAGKAMNGQFALQKIPKLQPDVIVLDLEMPEMNGIEFLAERRKRGIEIPVVILSSIARKGAQVTMEALSLGAADFIMKPSGSVSDDIQAVNQQLTELLRAYGRQYREHIGMPDVAPGPAAPVATKSTAATRVAPDKAREPEPAVEHPPVAPARPAGPVEIIAIGISTGGPNALRRMFTDLDGELPAPVLVVQHMPAGFTEEFAKSLDRICPLEVKEARDGDIVKPGRVLIAPGDHHLAVDRRPLATVVRVTDEPPVNGHRPSADVLFQSVARHFGNRCVAVIMTGMGKDGANGIGTVYAEGGITIGQDAGSCVVYGMPKVAAERGYLHHVVPLSHMAETLSQLARGDGDASS